MTAPEPVHGICLRTCRASLPVWTRSSRERPRRRGRSLLALDRRAATRFAAMDSSNVVGSAVDAVPSRAWPRLNVGPNYVRPATGQRRITARVMRSFGRRLPHTLPFLAHPRVASRPKSPARARATLFGLPATFLPAPRGVAAGRSGWNRKRSVPLALLLVNPGVVGGASAAAKRYAARKGHVRYFSHFGLGQVRGGICFIFASTGGCPKGRLAIQHGNDSKSKPKVQELQQDPSPLSLMII
ncbi:MAG: hypothetical protein BWX54_01400 [Verrucomicrobia bacterium ADurb.Bin018]|nr:MAG: hypothetical protein BWX54_01400 [Verrucomicrobia bacterium ADurb.Bin018]